MKGGTNVYADLVKKYHNGALVGNFKQSNQAIKWWPCITFRNFQAAQIYRSGHFIACCSPSDVRCGSLFQYSPVIGQPGS